MPQILLSANEYEEIREKIQLLETIIDGENLRIKPNKKRLSLALSTVRSIQTKYFPQLNYSLYYFRGGRGIGNQPLARTNYRKWKKEKMKREHPKLEDFLNQLNVSI